MTTTNTDDVIPLKIKMITDGLGVSELPQLKGMKLLVNNDKGHFTIKQHRLNYDLVTKLLAGEEVTTNNTEDVIALQIRDNGYSELPELQGAKFTYHYHNGYYTIKRI